MANGFTLQNLCLSPLITFNAAAPPSAPTTSRPKAPGQCEWKKDSNPHQRFWCADPHQTERHVSQKENGAIFRDGMQVTRVDQKRLAQGRGWKAGSMAVVEQLHHRVHDMDDAMRLIVVPLENLVLDQIRSLEFVDSIIP